MGERVRRVVVAIGKQPVPVVLVGVPDIDDRARGVVQRDPVDALLAAVEQPVDARDAAVGTEDLPHHRGQGSGVGEFSCGGHLWSSSGALVFRSPIVPYLGGNEPLDSKWPQGVESSH
ncbi:hypothetical protein ABZT47_36915 [Sphaerisporangium sp. NPDC005289]|uniref:hypothetical protein n=1 Tax=Sphaerisporangium sp. NPDC005289 TaxID=3155247 RepID=UPI0033A84DF7